MCRLHLDAFFRAESASISKAEGRLPPFLGNLRVTRQIQQALRQILCQLVEARLRGELVFRLLD